MDRPLIAIVGPTGSGKSALGLHLALKFGGEIVNFDSLQLYRGFDVGTAKTPLHSRQNVPHHLLDVLDPNQSFSAGDYSRAAIAVFGAIRLPILVGGTGFYLRALLDGLPTLPGRDLALRTRLLRTESRSTGSLHRLLARLEPNAAGRIHSNDVQKLLRALEIRLLTQADLPDPEFARPLEGFRPMQIGLMPDRTRLQAALEARTRDMFANGLIEEVRGLLASGCDGSEKPFEALGYKQCLLYLKGDIDLGQAIESTTIETRQYAKRQLTWFRRDMRIHWIEDFGNVPAAVAEAESAVGEFLAQLSAGKRTAEASS